MNWKSKLDIKDSFQAAKNGEITIQQLAAEIVQKVKRRPDYETDYDLQDVIDQMESIAEDVNATADDFDYVFNELYDWADELVGPGAKRCWITTF